jgi:DNA/RNA endonuclease YhcR with UshA esterase domain
MEMIITAGIALLSQLVPGLTGSAAVGSAIKFLAAIIPPAITLVKGEIPVIKGLIATLRGNKDVTVEQMAELDALDAQCDGVLDNAINKAEAADATGQS